MFSRWITALVYIAILLVQSDGSAFAQSAGTSPASGFSESSSKGDKNLLNEKLEQLHKTTPTAKSTRIDFGIATLQKTEDENTPNTKAIDNMIQRLASVKGLNHEENLLHQNLLQALKGVKGCPTCSQVLVNSGSNIGANPTITSLPVQTCPTERPYLYTFTNTCMSKNEITSKR